MTPQRKGKRKRSRDFSDFDSDVGDGTHSASVLDENPDSHARAGQKQTEVEGRLKGDDFLLKARLSKVVKIPIYEAIKVVYTIKRQLYIGNFTGTEVMKCTEKATGAKYAVKVLNKNSLFDRIPESWFKRCLFLEAAALTNILPAHPNIVKLHKVYEAPGCICIVTERLSPWTLRTYMASYKFDAEICLVFRKIVEAVNHLHTHGLCHNDLTLDIICFRKSNLLDPILIDFGSAKPLDLPCEDKRKLKICKPLSKKELSTPETKDVDMRALGKLLESLLIDHSDQARNFKENTHPYALGLLTHFFDHDATREMSTVFDIFEHPWFAMHES